MAGSLLALSVTLFLIAATLPGPASAADPVVPESYDSTFFSNLTAPSLNPGGSGSIDFQVADPLSFEPITAVVVTLQVYAFDAYPGNATSPLASSGIPVLVTPTESGTSVNVSLSSLGPGQPTRGSVDVVTSQNTPAGDFAVRTALSFLANGIAYHLESRGWFTASAWAAATELPGGNLTVNLTRLGVSGITAETAILVTSSNWEWALALILVAAVVLVGAGAFVYFRRGPKSSSGVR